MVVFLKVKPSTLDQFLLEYVMHVELRFICDK